MGCWGGSYNEEVSTASGTWTKPAGITYIDVIFVGDDEGGGCLCLGNGGFAVNTSGGGGGGSWSNGADGNAIAAGDSAVSNSGGGGGSGYCKIIWYE